jgi:hypothetical protein
MHASDTSIANRIKLGETQQVSWNESDQRVIDEQLS